MGVDLFWGYSEPYIQDGFYFEGEGVELNKIYPGKTPHWFQLLQMIELFTNVSVGKAKLFTKSRFLGACPITDHVGSTATAEAG